MNFVSPESALGLVTSLGAPPRLLRHIELVMEAADAIIDRLSFLRIHVRDGFIRVGVIFHDAGKILHPVELDGGGDLHEESGQALLLSHGIPLNIARVCLSHARWRDTPDVTLEELIVALADRLWKGKRDPELELAVLQLITGNDGSWSRWDLFIPLDTLFESIAAGGHERLERGRV